VHAKDRSEAPSRAVTLDASAGRLPHELLGLLLTVGALRRHDAVLGVVVQQAQCDVVEAASIAEICVRTSMQ